MNLGQLIRRSLLFYWRTGVVVVFGLAVATSITTGSLLIGDSVTGSLRDTALARLGNIDYALVAPHYFRADLTHRLSSNPVLRERAGRIVPAATMQGAIRNLATGESVPRVSVIGVDDSFWRLYPGQPAPELTGRQVAVNAALAGDLGVKEGDFVLLSVARESAVPADTLFARRSLEETTSSLRLQVKAVLPDSYVGGLRLDGTYHTGTEQVTVRGIVEMTRSGADPGLVPDFEGLTDAERIGDWHPPFPIDLTRITPRDETYWDKYRAAPKAFLHRETVRAMWASGPSGEQADWVTSVRIMPAAGTDDLERLGREFTRALLRRLSAQETGLTFQPLRRLLLKASRGTTNFSQLMLGMSMFLVVAGAGLAGMLLRLSADRRAAEAGIMMACGHRAQTAVRVIRGEGAVLTLLGVLVGVPLGVLYAWGIITALTTWWRGAVANSPLWLHVGPTSLLGGASAGLVVGLLAAAWGARALGHRSVIELLSGWQSLSVVPVLPRRRWVGFALGFFLLGAAVLVLLSAGGQLLSPSAAFFGSGSLLLLAGMAAASVGLTRAVTQRGASRSLGALALRSAAANRGRSLLTIGLLASATFVIVAVAANTRDLSRVDVTRRDAGSGGFALAAVCSLPLNYDLGSPQGRVHLGFSPDQEALLTETEIMSFLASPGQDISCLNLARPTHPRVLGVSDTMIAWDGFSVLTTQGKSAKNPWLLLRQSAADRAIPAFGDANTVRWSLDSSLGKTYTVPDGSGRPARLRFVGVIPASIFASELLVAQDYFKRLFPSVEAPSYFLIATPAGKEEQVAQVLRVTLGDRGLEVRSTCEVLNSFLRVQNTYLMMFLALGGLGLLLGSVGLVAVLLRNALERRAEFALMLATGFERNRLARILLLENAGLLLAGLFWGTLSALVAVAPQILSVESRVAWGALALVLTGIIVVGLVVSTIVAPMAVRGNLLEALREE